MLLSVFILWVVSIPFSVISADLPAPKGFLLSCGSTENVEINGLKYVPDHGFISVGNGTSVKTNDTTELLPLLSKVRFFPDKLARKNCYSFPVIKGAKYMVRTTYYYGDFDGRKQPPIFDQIIDGTRWSIVNVTEDYQKGLASYYELVVGAQSPVLTLCVARNEMTSDDSSPFISALEVMSLDDSVYKAVNFQTNALSNVARSTFGFNDSDNLEANFISYPDDAFHRFWQPYKDTNPIVKCQYNITSSDFWNVPPSKALNSGITTSKGQSLQIQWPPMPLPSGNYHISLYFQDNRTPSPFSWRVFSISINGDPFYSKLNVSTSGVNVYATEWPLTGRTQIRLTPDDGIPVGPIINAGEVFQFLPLAGKTNAKDAIIMEELGRSFSNPPLDWVGDPCLPEKNSWSGVSCSNTNGIARVTTLNLTGMGITGSLPPTIGNLASVVHLWLGNNKLSGQLPDISAMKLLETLHLEDNQFEGSVPESLGKLPRIREIYLQNNKFKGDLPESLKYRQGLTIGFANYILAGHNQ